jgi:hypothetical protein
MIKHVKTRSLVAAVISALLLSVAMAPAQADPVPASSQNLVPDNQWRPWAQQYLASVGADESVPNIAPRGAISDGIAVIEIARQVWSEAYGAERVAHQEPYRSYRKNNRWLVASRANQGQLGQGLILVIDRDTGRIIRIADGGTP